MVDGLDSWQAMELDAALALKYSTLEKEGTVKLVESILSGIDNVIRSNGAKIKKRKAQQSLIRPYLNPKERKAVDDLPLVDDVLKALGGGMTVIETQGTDGNSK